MINPPAGIKKLGSAPAPGVAVDALVCRREQRSASLDSLFLYQPPPGVPALWLKNPRPCFAVSAQQFKVAIPNAIANALLRRRRGQALF